MVQNCTIIPRAEHEISRQHIDEAALKTLYRLNKAGYKACLVGGAVRDLLLKRRPKDFDVATDATPEQVAKLFRNCRLIGRRFRLAHVHYGRTIIEVATFRGAHDDSSKGQQSYEGRILRDNVYGSISDDVWRRDFTVNALYYDIADFSVIDYVGGVEDIRHQRLRLIGDPDTRYREDPVRMLRAVRFAAKLGFSIDSSCRDFIFNNGELLQSIPPARLYEEALKMFHSGHAADSLHGLREYGLLQYLFPAATAGLHNNPVAEAFLMLAMQSTDARVHNEQPVTPAFLFSALLWASLQQDTQRRVDAGLPYSIALQKAATEMLDAQIRYVSIPRRFTTVMRDIWALQTRFHYRTGKRKAAILAHPKFRAGFDFLCLRAKAGEPVQDDCAFWSALQSQAHSGGYDSDSDSDDETDNDNDFSDDTQLAEKLSRADDNTDTGAGKKRRRRRTPRRRRAPGHD
jgi:poly(A) polymerase